MKKLLLSLAIVAMATAATAQDAKMETKPFKISVGVTAGIPLGDIKTYSSFVVGGDLQGDYNVGSNLNLTVSAGYLKYIAKSGYETSGLIPVLAGAKYFFTPNVYGHAQLGLVIATSTGGGTAFAYAPSVGYQVSQNFDISLKYLSYSKASTTTSALGLRFAYSF